MFGWLYISFRLVFSFFILEVIWICLICSLLSWRLCRYIRIVLIRRRYGLVCKWLYLIYRGLSKICWRLNLVCIGWSKICFLEFFKIWSLCWLILIIWYGLGLWVWSCFIGILIECFRVISVGCCGGIISRSIILINFRGYRLVLFINIGWLVRGRYL